MKTFHTSVIPFNPFMSHFIRALKKKRINDDVTIMKEFDVGIYIFISYRNLVIINIFWFIVSRTRSW